VVDFDYYFSNISIFLFWLIGLVIRGLGKSLEYFVFFSCYGLVFRNKSCNFALPNDERGFGGKRKELCF
jgi:hypothetical protein